MKERQWYHEFEVFALIHIISLPPLYHLPILYAVNLNSDLEFTTVAKSIVKSVDLLRLIRHASPILGLRTTIGLVRRIAQIEIGGPDIAIYVSMHHTSAIILLEQVNATPRVSVRLTGDFVLHHTVTTVVPERDFVVLVAIALKVPARSGAHAALGLAHLAVEVVVVPDVDGHNVVE